MADKNDLGVKDEERKLALMYLEQIKDDYIEGVGYERYPLPEYYAIETAIKSLASPSVTPEPKIKVLDRDEVIRKLAAVDIYQARAWITLLNDLELLELKICEVEE